MLLPREGGDLHQTGSDAVDGELDQPGGGGLGGGLLAAGPVKATTLFVYAIYEHVFFALLLGLTAVQLLLFRRSPGAP